MTKRRRRLLAAGAILLVLVALGATFGWWNFLSPARLRVRVQQALAEAIRADVTVGGARWSWLTGLLLRDVVVRETPDSPAFVLKAATLRVSPSYRDLLRGRLTVKRVRAGKAELNIALTPEFTWPFYERLPKSDTSAGIPELFITQSTVRISMPGAAERFPPIELSDVAATMRSSADGVSLATFSAAAGALGHLSGNARVAPEGRGITGDLLVEKLALTPALRGHLPADARQVWDALKPAAGVLRLTASLDWDPARDEPLRYAGTLKLHGGEFHPGAIGLPLEGMALDVKAGNGKVEQLSLSGHSGSIQLTGSGQGEFFPAKGFVGCFNAEARSIRFDRTLYASLPRECQEVWNDLKPQGMVDLAVTAALPENGVPALKAHLTLHNVLAAPAGFPLALSSMNGSLDWDLHKFSTAGIEGRIGGAPFKLSTGYADLAQDGPILLALRVENLLLDHSLKQLAPDLIAAAPPDARPLLDLLHVSGAFDLALSAAREKGTPLRLKGVVKVRDMLLTHPQRGALQNITGELLYETALDEKNGEFSQRNWSLLVGRSTAVWRRGKLLLEPFKLSGPEDAAWKVSVSAKDLAVDDQITSLLPEAILPVWEEFKPTGVADVKLTIEKPAGAKSESHVDMFASLRNGSIRFAGFPYPFQDVSGTLALVDNQFDQAHCKGKNGLATLAVDVARKVEKETGETLAIHVVGAGIPLDHDLYDAIPEAFQEFWDSFSISGGAVENLDVRLNVFPRDTERDPFNFTASATFARVRMEKSVAILLDRGRLVVQNAEGTSSGGVQAEGTFDLERCTVERSTLEDLSGFFRWKESGLSIENLVGRAYDGTVSGLMYVAMGESDDPGRQFRGKLTLYDADVARVLREEAGITEGGMDGRLDASIDFRAPLSDSGKFRAVGAMTLRNGTIGKLPGFLGVLNLLVLSKLGAPAFSGLEMAYEMRGSLLLIHKLNLTGDVISLEGTGRIQPDGNVQLTFVPYFGPQLPKIPVISWGLNEITSTIKSIAIPISVHGNYNDPVWKINPLMPLTRIIQGIVGGVAPPRKKAETAPVNP